jgi:FkbM family methyltransferase
MYRRIGELRRSMLGRYAIGVLTETSTGLFLVPSGDFAMGHTLAFIGAYEPIKIEHLCSQVDDKTDVLVIGAHIGTLVVPLARCARSVTAVEANPWTFGFLLNNVGLNRLRNVTCLNFAAGDNERQVEMLCGSHNSGASRLKQGFVRSGIYRYDKMDRVSVQMKALDRVFSSESFGLITMDIEGSETLALKGMPRLLSRAYAYSVEVVPTHIEQLGSSSKGALLEHITPHFRQAMVLGTTSPVHCREDFPYLLSQVWQVRKDGTGEDVLFLK